MGDQPYRTIGQRIASPSSSLTMEHVVDLRLCVGAMTPAQCRDAINQLDDHEVKNAVYDRVLCFPGGEWTKGIQEAFAKKVHATNKNVIDFTDSLDQMQSLLNRWAQLHVFSEEDFKKLEVDVRCKLSPCLDYIGVYSTMSEYVLTKRNGVEKLTSIGLMILETPIFRTPQGKAALTYDALSRAVGNILNSIANKTQRKRILEYGVDANLEHLERQARKAGIFLYLSRAMSPDPAPATYWLPEIQPKPQAQKSGRKRKTLAQNQDQAKKAKWNNHPQQGTFNPQQVIAEPQQGIASSQQDIFGPQRGIAGSHPGMLNPEQGTAKPQQGAVNSWQGTLDPQQGIIAPQQDVFKFTESMIDPQLSTASFEDLIDPRLRTANFQQGIIDPQLDTANLNQGAVAPPQGIFGAQGDNTNILDLSSDLFPADPDLWQNWWPLRPKTVPSKQSHRVIKGSPAVSEGSSNVFGPTSSTSGKTYVSSVDNHHQPGPSGNGMGQEMGLKEGSKQPQNAGQDMLSFDYSQPAFQQQQQYQAADQTMPTQQSLAAGQLVQQHQNVGQNMPARYTPAQKGKQHEIVGQAQQPQKASSYQGVQQNMPKKPIAARNGKKRQAVGPAQQSQAQQSQPQQGVQQTMPGQPTEGQAKPSQQALPREGLQQNMPAQSTASKKKPGASAKKTKDPAAQEDEQPHQLSYYKFEPASFDDLITDAYNELFVRKFNNPEQAQAMPLPIVVIKRIETGVKMVQSRVKKVLNAPNVDASKEIILKTKESAIWALLWFLEHCAIDRAGTALSAEVTRQLGRDVVVQSLWGCVMESPAEDMKRLLHCISARPENDCTFEVKLDAIIQTLNITQVTGWEMLQYILDEMRRVASQA